MRKRILCLMLCVSMAASLPFSVKAVSISSVRKEQEKTKNNLSNLENEISNLEDEKQQANQQLGELENELVDILSSIEICEEEIDIKKKEIDEARDELMVLQGQEKEQYDNMKKRVRFMYEQGSNAYLQVLLGSDGYADMVNKADYIEKLYSYDQQLLADYVESKEEMAHLKVKLENEEADLEACNYELEQEQAALEELVEEKKETVADFAAQLSAAKNKVEDYKKELQRQNEQIRQLEIAAEQERKRQAAEAKRKAAAAAAAANGDGEGTTDDADYSNFSAGAGDTIDVSVGSGTGQQVVNYACQFIGNPYVFGGTSLTNGTDCSGFTQAVYAHFGISIPRDSFSQRSCGQAVDYASARPGDIICYAGHVAIYMGGGQIVHASTERTGITTGPAAYRTILSVRRIVN